MASNNKASTPLTAIDHRAEMFQRSHVSTERRDSLYRRKQRQSSATQFEILDSDVEDQTDFEEEYEGYEDQYASDLESPRISLKSVSAINSHHLIKSTDRYIGWPNE